MIWVVRTDKFLERAVENSTSLPEFYAEHGQGTAIHIPTLAHPRHLQSLDDILRSKHLRVYDAVNAHCPKHFLVLFLGILVFLNLCHSMLHTKTLGHGAGTHIHFLVVGDGNEQVGR